MAGDAQPDRYSIRLVDWSESRDPLRDVRRTVFIVEQNIPEDMEWDAADAISRHALAVDAGGRAVGCGRLLPDGHIGRLAVVAAWRKRGVGSALLTGLVELARTLGHNRVALNAQTHAVPFYAAHGFVVAGDEYLEAGIPHRAMERTLR
jgi:predicted GNAT family N-acyltransferase